MDQTDHIQDKMKILYCTFIFLLFSVTLNAQETSSKLSNTFLFKQFVKGIIQLKDKSCIETLFNYNCENQVLYYKDGSEYKEIYNTSNIDTLYISNRKFIPAREEPHFLECIPAEKHILLVDWKIKFYYQGKRGAMGVVTQAGGQSTVDMEYVQRKGLSNPDNSIYKMGYKNTYWINMNGKLVSFTNLKSLLKLYPEADQKSIKQLAKQRSVKFNKPWQVAKLLIMHQRVKDSLHLPSNE